MLGVYGLIGLRNLLFGVASDSVIHRHLAVAQQQLEAAGQIGRTVAHFQDEAISLHLFASGLQGRSQIIDRALNRQQLLHQVEIILGLHRGVVGRLQVLQLLVVGVEQTAQLAITVFLAVALQLAIGLAPEDFGRARHVIGAGRLVQDDQQMIFLENRSLTTVRAVPQTTLNGGRQLPFVLRARNHGLSHDAYSTLKRACNAHASATIIISESRPVKRQKFILILALCLLTIIGSALMWLLADESLNDNRLPGFTLASKDPAVNGYALLEEHTQSEAWLNEDQEHLSTENWNHGDEGVPWSDDELANLFEEHADTIAITEEALNRPEFGCFNLNYKDSVNSVYKVLGNYSTLVNLRAEQLIRQDRQEEALSYLIKRGELLSQLVTMNDLFAGPLMAIASNGRLQSKIYELINDPATPREALQKALEQYPFLGQLDHAHANSLPIMHAALAESITSESSISELGIFYFIDLPDKLETVFKKFPRLGLKPNKTANRIRDIYEEEIAQKDKPLLERNNSRAEAAIAKIKSDQRWYSNNILGDQLTAQTADLLINIRRMTARSQITAHAQYLLLALRLYEHDHGQLPPTLDALVPDYIPAVPEDPYDGKPLRYDPARRIVYSIGEDGVDSGGSSLPTYLHNEDDDDGANGFAEHDDAEPTHFLKDFNAPEPTPADDPAP